MFQAVAFDLDDTLAVTVRDRETLLEDAAARAEVEATVDRESYLDAHRAHSGTESRRPVFEALVGESDAADALTRSYREAIGDAMEPVEGAEALLATLRGRYRIGLLTDGPDRTQRGKLGRLGWEDAFDAVVVTGALGAPKPAAEGFLAVAEALDAPPSAIAYVGDDPERDVAGAAEAGMTPIQVVYDGGPAVHPDAARIVMREELFALPGILDALADGADDA